MAEIRLTGLRVRGFHGVLPEERRDGQDFLVDAQILVDDPRDDDLAQTVDYGALAQRLAEVVAGEPVDLIETLAQRLLAVCLAEPGAEWARVTVHKPSAPIPLPFADVSVTVSAGPPRRRAVLSIGSNVGDRLGHLAAAVDLLVGAYGEAEVSPVYETDPVGGPEQEPYLNAVVTIPAFAEPAAILRLAHAIERARDRERTVRWGPRTLDVDLVAVGLERLDIPNLTLPHPRAHERAFVLVPWLDLDPDAALPGHGRVTDLLAGLDTSGVRRTEHLLVP